MILNFGDAAAREVSRRIGGYVATTAALTAVPPGNRTTGQLFLVLADLSLWVVTAGSAPAAAGVLVPDSGSGRFELVGGAGSNLIARGVVTANVADLTAFTVASNDGLTYAAGQLVLLAAQTTASQNGLYEVGTVASTTAPLTRPTFWATGSVVAGMVIEVSEGTLFAKSSWKLTSTAAITVDTTSVNFYPRFVAQQLALSSGTVTISNVPLFSATKSVILINRITAGSPTNTVAYNPITLTPGIVGTSSIVVNAQVAAGTINASDTSTLNIAVQNW